MAEYPVRASKAVRFEEFLRRLGAAPPACDFNEAYRQLCEILNAVEDEMTDIRFDPENWQNDGRMYPPQFDNVRLVPGRDDVRQLRSRGHRTLIADNGAIEIRDLSGQTVFARPGSDGRSVQETT